LCGISAEAFAKLSAALHDVCSGNGATRVLVELTAPGARLPAMECTAPLKYYASVSYGVFVIYGRFGLARLAERSEVVLIDADQPLGPLGPGSD
jgi:hypothetical protein